MIYLYTQQTENHFHFIIPRPYEAQVRLLLLGQASGDRGGFYELHQEVPESGRWHGRRHPPPMPPVRARVHHGHRARHATWDQCYKTILAGTDSKAPNTGKGPLMAKYLKLLRTPNGKVPKIVKDP